MNALPICSGLLGLFVVRIIHTDPILKWPVLIAAHAHNRPTFSKSGWNDFRLVQPVHFPHPSLLTLAVRVLTGRLNFAAVCFGLLV